MDRIGLSSVGGLMKALVIGVSSYDTLIEIDQFPTLKSDVSIWAKNVHYSVGGTGAGKSLSLDTLGVDTTLVTDLGKDEYRQKILDIYKQTKIHTKVLLADVTTTHTNIMYDGGKRLSIFTSMSKEIEFNPKIEDDIQKSEVVFLSINDYCKHYIPYIKKHDKLCVVDIHDYDIGNPYHQAFIQAADILFASGVNIDDDIQFLKEHIKNKQLVILTKAEKGSLAIDKNHKIYHQSAFKQLPLLDTNGAGDGFSAGFIFALLKKKPIQYALAFASVCGAMVCSSRHLFNPDTKENIINKYIQIWHNSESGE